MIDWVPVALIIFKVLVLGTGMFFAIKWHYDQETKDKDTKKEKRAVGKVAAVFVLSVWGLVYLTFVFAKMRGLDLTFP